MAQSRLPRWTRRLPVLAPAVLLAALASPAPAESAPPSCGVPAELILFNRTLPHLAERAATRSPLTIVAVGSSSTAGFGASSPAATYPSRLEAILRSRAGGIPLNVLNRGVNGEEIREMLARFDRGVIAEKPDLVLWQIGTNSVLHDREVTGNASVLAEGLNRLKSTGADVVLINPQFAPKVLAKPAVEPMLRLISATAKQADVQVFNRFAVMKYWREVAKIPFAKFLSPDLLHMNDWGYNCIAQLLADAIVAAVVRPPATAAAPAARQ
jgi:lysophospholipase L1-like esterase